jgi:hypothetical protein
VSLRCAVFPLAASMTLFLAAAPYAQWDPQNPNPECGGHDEEDAAFCSAATSLDPSKCEKIVDEQRRLYCRGSSGDKEACGYITNSMVRGFCWKRLSDALQRTGG